MECPEDEEFSGALDELEKGGFIARDGDELKLAEGALHVMKYFDVIDSYLDSCLNDMAALAKRGAQFCFDGSLARRALLKRVELDEQAAETMVDAVLGLRAYVFPNSTDGLFKGALLYAIREGQLVEDLGRAYEVVKNMVEKTGYA